MLKDVAISVDRNVKEEEAEKILKYKDLIRETQCMWHVKAKVIPVLKGATGNISESFRPYLSNIPGKHEIKELQNNHIEYCTHTTESVNVNVQNVFRG